MDPRDGKKTKDGVVLSIGWTSRHQPGFPKNESDWLLEERVRRTSRTGRGKEGSRSVPVRRLTMKQDRFHASIPTRSWEFRFEHKEILDAETSFPRHSLPPSIDTSSFEILQRYRTEPSRSLPPRVRGGGVRDPPTPIRNGASQSLPSSRG